MLEHDCDTDEDCEVYFLKPVNEYNIVDKIKEANKELFDAEDVVGTDVPSDQKRKVKFRVKLEDYEPNSSEVNNSAATTTDTVERDECCEVLSLDEDSWSPSERGHSTIEECAEQLAMEVQKKIESIDIRVQNSDDEVEEICEEILEMDMKKSPKPQITEVNEPNIPADLEAKCEEELNEENENNEELLEDDDDKLSIIVASYLPRDPPECEDSKSTFKAHPFRRHFSFRRKTSKTSNRRPHSRSPEITNLMLNYKTCCEHRNAEPIKLPKYTGYMSEYGLSRDQLDQRDQTLQVKHRVVVEKNLKASEANIRKMQDNERAFTTWLKNKMRFPINRTKNMFDIKKSNNSGGNGKNGIFRSN